MTEVKRNEARYTELFCEENVWWLARRLVDAGTPSTTLQVLLFCNPTESVLLFNQQAAAPGHPTVWDYHVVLRAATAGDDRVFDLDSRLPFPSPTATYLARTFPDQSHLPENYRTFVRVIPGASYLARFHSDRTHMLGRLPPSAFPDYPVIEPQPGIRRITLAEYRDMTTQLDDGSEILPVDALAGHRVRSRPMSVDTLRD